MNDYIIYLVGVVILLQLVLIFKKSNNKDDMEVYQRVIETMQKNNNENTKQIHNLQLDHAKQLNDFSNSVVGVLNKNELNSIKNFNELKENINTKINDYNKELHLGIDRLNSKVENRLKEGFNKSDQTFLEITKRLQTIDNAQAQIEKLSINISSLQDVLSDKKSRGTFGELQLSNILSSMFGENKQQIYQLQYTLENNTKVDAILHLPQPLGSICIDSKFPLENYQRMFNSDCNNIEKELAKKQFKQDVKKHINDISTKYIISNVTSNQAIMFVPSEAVFAEINAYHEDIISYSSTKNVWLASPTTLMSMLTTIQVVLKNIERDKYSKRIQYELNRLSDDFKRYQDRWQILSKNISLVSKNVEDINITSNKISKKFESISNVELDESQIKNIE